MDEGMAVSPSVISYFQALILAELQLFISYYFSLHNLFIYKLFLHSFHESSLGERSQLVGFSNVVFFLHVVLLLYLVQHSSKFNFGPLFIPFLSMMIFL